MSKNPFVILGVPENASQNEVYDAYKRLRDFYGEQRFQAGEAGADAAERYAEIEEAYREATDIINNRNYANDFGTPLSKAEKYLKDGNIDEAQRTLDSIDYRNDEWHYLQAAIYYKRGWLDEAKKQIEISLNLSPDNEKYRKTYNELSGGAKRTQQQQTAQPNFGNPYESPRNYRTEEQGRTYRQRSDTDTACNICSGLICADCCCECMGGDLISCC